MPSGTIGGALDQHVFRCTVRFRRNNQKMQTGFFVRDVAVNDNSCEDVANVVDGWVTTNFRTLLQNLDPVDAVDVVRLMSEEGFTKEYTGLTGTKSIVAVSVVPTFLAAQIALKTQRRKRYGQGRMFWPLVDENDFTGDSLTSGAVTAFQGVIDALTTLFTGSDLTHDLKLCTAHGVIAPRAAHGSTPARPEIPPTWYDVDAVKLNTAVTMLRSRKVGIGA